MLDGGKLSNKSSYKDFFFYSAGIKSIMISIAFYIFS